MPSRRNTASRFPLHLASASAIAALLAACAGAPSPATSTTPAGSAARVTPPEAPLTAAQERWVDSTLASLPLRERIGQMVNVWVLGDYTSEQDSSYQQVLRWVEQD
ncbi:MAG: hypothetical protein HOQ09_04645, partial [Gemmatimonadaceae bacterium]|nr:hypothetical protein [Gemmatimonadaceae bacterium]